MYLGLVLCFLFALGALAASLGCVVFVLGGVIVGVAADAVG